MSTAPFTEYPGYTRVTPPQPQVTLGNNAVTKNEVSQRNSCILNVQGIAQTPVRFDFEALNLQIGQLPPLDPLDGRLDHFTPTNDLSRCPRPIEDFPLAHDVTSGQSQ